MNAAGETAHRAFQTNWRWRTPAERATLLLEAADVLGEHADELALLESGENGTPVAERHQPPDRRSSAPSMPQIADLTAARIRRRRVLGGLMHEDQRAA